MAEHHTQDAELLNADELAALRRFDECAQDGEGYDVPKEMMQRLAEIGVVRRKSGSFYQHTEFGLHVLERRSIPQGDEPAEEAFEKYRQEQARIPGMPGLHARPSFIAGHRAGRAGVAAQGDDLPPLPGA